MFILLPWRWRPQKTWCMSTTQDQLLFNYLWWRGYAFISRLRFTVVRLFFSVKVQCVCREAVGASWWAGCELEGRREYCRNKKGRWGEGLIMLYGWTASISSVRLLSSSHLCPRWTAWSHTAAEQSRAQAGEERSLTLSRTERQKKKHILEMFSDKSLW